MFANKFGPRTITRGGRYKLCLFMGHGIHLPLVPPRNFRDVHGDDFIRLRWFYGGGCTRKRDSPAGTFEKLCFARPVLVHFPLSLSLSLFFFLSTSFFLLLHFFSPLCTVRMKECEWYTHVLENNLNYSWNRFFIEERICTNYGIVIIVISMTNKHFGSIQK